MYEILVCICYVCGNMVYGVHMYAHKVCACIAHYILFYYTFSETRKCACDVSTAGEEVALCCK